MLEQAETPEQRRQTVLLAEQLYTQLPEGPSTTRDLVRLLAILTQMVGGPATSDSPIAYLLEPASPALLSDMTSPNELRVLLFQFAHQSAQMQAHLRTPRHPSESIEQPDFFAELVRQFGFSALDNLERLRADGAIPYLRPEQIEQAQRFRAARQLANELSQARRQTVVEIEATQCDLYRDLFGYPYMAIEFPVTYRTPTVYQLAEAMYASADFRAMPILGDALMDAGCEEGEIIAHCRRPLPHARGCWLLERILDTSARD
jgi:hypothetical protein